MDVMEFLKTWWTQDKERFQATLTIGMIEHDSIIVGCRADAEKTPGGVWLTAPVHMGISPGPIIKVDAVVCAVLNKAALKNAGYKVLLNSNRFSAWVHTTLDLEDPIHKAYLEFWVGSPVVGFHG